MQKFSWEIPSVTTKEMAIKITFSEPAVFARDDSKQYIDVYAQFSDFEPGWADDEVFFSFQIPKQASND